MIATPPPIPSIASLRHYPLAATLLLASLFPPAGLAAAEAGHLPVPPSLLLEALPREIEGWALIESRAGTDFGAVWLESFAVRRFRPVRRGQEAAAPENSLVTLSILDTAAHPGSEVETFSGFAPAQEADAVRIFALFEGRPALMPRDRATSPLEIQLLVAERFLVTLRIEGTPGAKPAEWLQTIDFAKLEQIRPGPRVPLPTEFSAIRLDELSDQPDSGRTVILGAGPAPEEDETASESRGEGGN